MHLARRTLLHALNTLQWPQWSPPAALQLLVPCPHHQAQLQHAAQPATRGFGTEAGASVAALHHHPPRRAMLYVPGSAEKKVRKAAGEVSPDSIIMDCEDGVAASMKEAARATIALMLDDLDFGASEAAVRINPVQSGLAEEDLRAVLSAKRLPDALVVPKVEQGRDEVRWVMDRVQTLLAAQRPRPRVKDTSSEQQQHMRGPMAFIPMCESALALLDLRATFEYANSCSDHSSTQQQRAGGGGGGALQLQACIFGGDDFAASLGATRTPGNTELAQARALFLLVCRAHQVQAIDIVKIDLSDEGMAALLVESKEAALAGFSGKQVIHPKQVPVVQGAFSPSKGELEDAMRLVTAYHEHQARGHGAFIFEGKMIDAPTVLQARNVLALAERLEQLV